MSIESFKSFVIYILVASPSTDGFSARITSVIFVSATPADYENEHSKENVVEQIIRPTGLLDPKIEVRPVTSQIDDLIEAMIRVMKSDNTFHWPINLGNPN